MLLQIFYIPLTFIKEHLTGWVVLALLILIIYCVVLRNYYLQKEQFYDDNEQHVNFNIKSSNKNNKDSKDSKDSRDNKNNNKIIKNNIPDKQQKHPRLKNVTENFLPKNDTENTETTQYAPNTDAIQKNIIQPDIIQKDTIQYTIQQNTSTTLFDILKLTTLQLQRCIEYYKTIIIQYINELKHLMLLQKNNKNLDTRQQFNLIIQNGINDIINYLNTSIKANNIITRTNIRIDVLKTLNNVLDLHINNINNNLTTHMNNLAMLNSTTLDYNTQLQEIEKLRVELGEYINIDKIINNSNNNSNSNYNKEYNAILNKSNILPIYEKNFDKIKQIINSDFNDNENTLATKYSKAYNDFIIAKQQDELDINPLRLGSKIESGIISLLTTLSGKTKKNNSVNNSMSDNNSSNARGSYLQDDKIKQTLVEQFITNDNSKTTNILKSNPDTSNTSKTSKTSNPDTSKTSNTDTSKTSKKNASLNITNAINKNLNNNNNNTTEKTNSVISKLMSGNFLQYIMDYISNKITIFIKYYNNYTNSNTDNTDKNTQSNNFNIEDNMMPAGFLCFILSMLFYFIDVTS